MVRGRVAVRLRASTEEVGRMEAAITVVVFLFVVAVLAAVGYALFQVTPFAAHRDRFRDARTGRRIESPRLD
jgi:hypothetical protein